MELKKPFVKFQHFTHEIWSVIYIKDSYDLKFVVYLLINGYDLQYFKNLKTFDFSDFHHITI